MPSLAPCLGADGTCPTFWFSCVCCCAGPTVSSALWNTWPLRSLRARAMAVLLTGGAQAYCCMRCWQDNHHSGTRAGSSCSSRSHRESQSSPSFCKYTRTSDRVRVACDCNILLGFYAVACAHPACDQVLNNKICSSGVQSGSGSKLLLPTFFQDQAVFVKCVLCKFLCMFMQIACQTHAQHMMIMLCRLQILQCPELAEGFTSA